MYIIILINLKMAILKRMWRKMRSYDVNQNQSVSDNFYRYLLDLHSM